MNKRVISGKVLVLSVGGSLIVPQIPDPKFLRKLAAFTNGQVQRGRRILIIAGGGKTARNYQVSLRQVRVVTRAELDWIGIRTTKLNGELVRFSLGRMAEKTIVENPTLPITTKKRVVVACGWKPGCSTDFDAVLMAKNVGAKQIINISNIDYAYTKDPQRYSSARPIATMGWREFRALLPEKWSPGLSSPFDPVAAREAERLKLEVAIINGGRFEEIEKYLDGKPFVGSLIGSNKATSFAEAEHGGRVA